MNLIFAGTPEFARTALESLVAAGHRIVLVLTQPDRPAGRGMKLLDYGRYTPYVLTSYGIAAAVIIGLIVWSVVRVTAAKKKLDAIEGAAKDATP